MHLQLPRGNNVAQVLHLFLAQAAFLGFEGDSRVTERCDDLFEVVGMLGRRLQEDNGVFEVQAAALAHVSSQKLVDGPLEGL